MKRLILFFVIAFFYNILNAQVQNLTKYIEQGRTFDEIYSKASKMLRKGQLSEEEEVEKKKRNKKYVQEEEFMRLERWAWYWKDRTNPDGSLYDPTEQWKLFKSAKSNNEFSRSSLNWKHEGPISNSGGYWAMGRTTHVDFHPTDANTFYVAAANGGLWKTTDSGLSYTSLGESLPQQPVGIVVVDQKNPNNIYITIGEKDGWWQYGLGVYKSTDAGKTWNPTGLSYKLSDNKVIFALAMSPTNSNILIAATNNGIHKTINGGQSWTKVRPENFSDVKFKIDNPNIVYAATNDYYGSCEVFQSSDEGDNWNQISNFNKQKSFFRLVTTYANPNYLGVNASEDGNRSFYLSKNAGQSFEFISNPPENSVLFISPFETDVVYCGYTKIHKSYDGGYSWKTITNWYNDGVLPEVHADHHFVSVNIRKPNELYFCNDGGLNRYDENSEDWQELSNGLPITQFYKMAISSTTPPVLIGGSQDNGGYVRKANGKWGNTNGGDAMWQLIDQTDSRYGFTEYYGGKAVYRTSNTFNNLTDIYGNIPGAPEGQWVTPFNLNPKNTKTFLIGYHDVFVSNDRGNSFHKISENLTGAEDKDLRNVEISPVDTNIVMATYANQLYYTYNFGLNWSKVTLPTSFDITSIEFHPTDTNRIWATRAGMGQFKVQESKDRGKTWKNITSNFVNTPASVVRFDRGSNTLFVGTDIGVFYSDADVINWQYYGNNLPNTSVTDIEIHKATRRMYISTFGRGFYSIELPATHNAVTLICPGKKIETACQIQDSINAKFASWINTATFTGGCNAVMSNNGIKKPSACGDTTIVTFTVISDCDSTMTCQDTFIVRAPPPVVLTCPSPVTEAACQTQAAIDTKFNVWLNGISFSGGCSDVMAIGKWTPPNACGGTTTVTFSVVSSCPSPVTCTSNFKVTNPEQVILTCPSSVTEAACQSQAVIDAKFAAWKNTASFTGGCNGVLTNSSGAPPNACGGNTFVTYSVTSSCQVPVTCNASFNVTPSPLLVVTCPPSVTEASCQSQATINAKFNAFKNSVLVSGGCNTIVTVVSGQAPSFCGGEALVTFTISSDCEPAKNCNSNFIVAQAPTVVLTCPANITVNGSDIQQEIEDKFLEWKNTASFSGGCNVVQTNNGPKAPSGLGGEVIVTFTVSSDCDIAKTCTAKFTVKSGVFTTNLLNDKIEIYPNPASDFILIKTKDKSIGKVELDLVDINGKIILQKKNFNLQINDRINIENITPGNYLLKIKIDKNTLEKKIEILR
ncbi:MAG: T9SS type A sorting domain-containing protein [Saprospiraceae bacterium]